MDLGKSCLNKKNGHIYLCMLFADFPTIFILFWYTNLYALIDFYI